MAFYIGLIHYPVYNKSGEVIASAITNLDLHDLARLARTYGAQRLYVINPLIDQQELAGRIRDHWIGGHGAAYNRDRSEAMALLSVVPTLAQAIAEIRDKEGTTPILIATDAGNDKGKTVPYPFVREILMSDQAAIVLFGTAWGIARELIKEADYLLEPIRGVSGYNHLSVRTAAAITLDRLLSKN
jgi:tRNA (guanine37-N1)-methyltransferase